MTLTRQQQAYARVWTVPNALSFFRLALIPVFLVALIVGQDIVALLTLVISSVTDFLDGYLARHLKQVTRLGELLDPAADRLYIFATLIGLSWRGLLPVWIVVAILARDLMLGVIGVVLARRGLRPLTVHRVGKVATFVILVALPVIMLSAAFPQAAGVADPSGWALAVAGAVLYWWAGLIYVRETVHVTRKRAPAP